VRTVNLKKRFPEAFQQIWNDIAPRSRPLEWAMEEAPAGRLNKKYLVSPRFPSVCINRTEKNLPATRRRILKLSRAAALPYRAKAVGLLSVHIGQ
jgi:hypothetical protein